MIPSAVVRFFQSVAPPEPGKEVYWIAGLMAGAIAFLWWNLRESDKAKTQVYADAIKRAHDREDKLLEVDAARSEVMRQLVVQVDAAAKLTQQVVDGSISLHNAMEVMGKGVEANAKAIGECNTTMDGMTLEFRNMALRVHEAQARGASGQGQ